MSSHRRETPEPADPREAGGLPLQVLEQMDPDLVRKVLGARLPRAWTLQPCTGFDPPD
ncbi:hypothetical protein [Planobispora longispora]|uniref:Uncharacterized protein n=1 Tax=Planobispora longispora TaxID=28887 RepID=A0A8J3RP42_9ACTN|nr:hypothetical protein [Planobispora longispora]GIH77337.1 hypothetical protein Plo01_37660 [Planobispora longispora]